MSKLRKKLQQARHEYQHLRYDGDLAADVLDQLQPAKKSSHWVRNLSIAASLALVATAGIVLFNRDVKKNDVAIVTPTNPNLVTTPNSNSGTTGTTPIDPVANPAEDPDTNNDTETTEEQVWSVVPSGLASASETSFSLVPSLASFSESSVDSIQAPSAEQ